MVLGFDVLDDGAVGSADDEGHSELAAQVGVEIARGDLLGVRLTAHRTSFGARIDHPCRDGRMPCARSSLSAGDEGPIRRESAGGFRFERSCLLR